MIFTNNVSLATWLKGSEQMLESTPKLKPIKGYIP